MVSVLDLKDSSSIMIFALEKELSIENILFIQKQWNAVIEEHSIALESPFGLEIFYNQIIVIGAIQALALTEKKISEFASDMGKKLNFELSPQTTVYFFSENQLLHKSIHEFWAMRKAKIITDETEVLDNSIKTVGELKSKWKIPFSQSWHNEMWT